jgi:hypothetical protein
MFYMYTTIFLFSLLLILGVILWKLRAMTIDLYIGFKHFFMRNRSYGCAYMFENGKILRKHYVKLVTQDKTIKINERVYNVVVEKIFNDYMGIQSLMYNVDDVEPLSPNDFDKSNNIIRSSVYWGNLGAMMKSYAELKASRQMGMVLMICLIVLIIVGINIGITGYLLYILTNNTAVSGSVAGVVNI